MKERSLTCGLLPARSPDSSSSKLEQEVEEVPCELPRRSTSEELSPAQQEQQGQQGQHGADFSQALQASRQRELRLPPHPPRILGISTAGGWGLEHLLAAER